MIHIIFTGGTIGCRKNESGTLSLRDTSFELIRRYEDRFGAEAAFSVSEPYRILSEDLSAKHLRLLIEEVKKAILANPEGIIITHGSDTLQYTAAILGYIFGGSKIPIVLVASNYILSDERSNGLLNFAYAIRFIREIVKGKSGVYVCYYNGGEFLPVHRATRLCGPVEFSDLLFSVNDMYTAKFVLPQKDPYKIDEARFLDHYDYFEHNDMDAMFWFHDEVHLTDYTEGIVREKIYPGKRYAPLPDGTKAVFLEGYHSGTAGPFEEMKTLLEDAERKKAIVYLTGLQESASEYESVRLLKEEGVCPLYDLAPIAQYCKAYLALSNDMDLRTVMRTVYAGEK